MRRLGKIIVISAIAVIVIALSGCSDNQPVSNSFFAMDTYMSVSAYGRNADAAVNAAQAEVERLDALLSAEDELSDIYALNSKGRAPLSDDTLTLLERGLEISDATGGCFDMTVYPLMGLWGFIGKEYRVPTEDEISAALKYVGSSAVSVDRDAGTAAITRSGTMVDPGGIAKGYASSRIMDIFREHGVSSGIVNLGGNVQVLGTKPDGSPWEIGIKSPDDSREFLAVLRAVDVAVVTSGGYERCFEQGGRTYHHILDPATGRPADSGLTSVTIVCNDGTLADAMSTALFVIGREDAVEYWRTCDYDFDMILMTDDDRLIVSDGLRNSIEPEVPDVEYVSK